MDETKILTAKLARSLAKKSTYQNFSDEDAILMNQILGGEIMSKIYAQILHASMSNRTQCHVTPDLRILGYADPEVEKAWADGIVKRLNADGFEVSVFENQVFSIDWSEDGPCSDIDDEYDNTEQYENMHKQKAKKQHAPRKHNLKVIK
jgi:hypothetical protein